MKMSLDKYCVTSRVNDNISQNIQEDIEMMNSEKREKTVVIENCVTKLEQNLKRKNSKAKNDIEDDIRKICGGGEEFVNFSENEDFATKKHISDNEEENSEDLGISKKNDSNQLKMKRSYLSVSLSFKEEEDEDLFGFHDGKFVFGKKVKTSLDKETSLSQIKKATNIQSISVNEKLDEEIINQTENQMVVDNQEGDEIIEAPKSSSTIPSQKLKPSEDPIYRKPFEMGWKREIVLRAQPGSKDKGEVYYITPSGKKLRTRHEIQMHLTPGLSLEHFTFSKDPLGADPEDEIIRNAKISGRGSESSTPKIPEIGSPASAKRIPKPKAPKGASPPPQGWTPTHAIKAQNLRQHSRSSQMDDTIMKSPKTTLQSSESTYTNKSGSATKKNIEINGASSNRISPAKIRVVDSYVQNLFGNVSAAYDIILNVFKYLKVQELLRAACVSRLWNHLANERSLWKIVRMKNSQVNDWAGFAATLSRNSTEHLDLRKMICPKSSVEKMWTNFSEHIQKVHTLKLIDLGRCPANVVQNLFLTCPQLNILNATSIRCETINLENINKLSNLVELRLKTVDRCNLVGDLTSFAHLNSLRHLSLTSINDLGKKNIEILGHLIELESLEIGECSTIQENFSFDVLQNLTKLQRLRLENSTEIAVTLQILQQISGMENLQQLELVNFDIRDGFEQKIINCKYLKRFLLIPTYVSQSATTNQIILSSMRKLHTLESFTWVVTLELLSVTALYVDQCGSRDRRNFNDCIPVLKPVPGASPKEDVAKKTDADIQQIEILPLSTIKEILDEGAPTTKHKIMRVSFATTWRQTFVE